MNSSKNVLFLHSETQTGKESDFDFEALITPDTDFDKRILEETTEISPPKIQPKENPFPELIIEEDFIQQELASQWIEREREKKSGTVNDILWFWSIQLYTEEKTLSKEETQQKVHLWTPSEIEKRIPFYTQKFQEILQWENIQNPQKDLQKYAKILLYLLEQFEITGGKKHHIKFMIELKKVLGEIQTHEQISAYR